MKQMHNGIVEHLNTVRVLCVGRKTIAYPSTLVKCKNNWLHNISVTVCVVEGLCLEDELRCTNLRCVPAAYVCDGDNDCGDYTDENNCGQPSL